MKRRTVTRVFRNIFLSLIGVLLASILTIFATIFMRIFDSVETAELVASIGIVVCIVTGIFVFILLSCKS